MKITNNVFMLESTRKPFFYKQRECYSMVYAVIEEDGISLIDSGFPTFEHEILDELRQLGKHQLSLKQIFLTHADLDHMGNASWLQQKTGCKVWIAQKELVYVAGQKKRFGAKHQMAIDCNLQIPEFVIYPENNRVGEFEVIPTPGHSEGHVCILYRKVIFGGDLFSFINGEFRKANPEWSEDIIEAERSLELIKNYPFKIICPAHGMSSKRKKYL